MMRIILFFLSIPYIWYALMLLKLRRGSIYDDYMLAHSVIHKNIPISRTIPDIYFFILVIAEDHRNKYHFGIDPIAIIRCIIQKTINNKRQGGSTIEQQLVRTITKKYDVSLKRKLREQVIAVMIHLSFRDKKTLGKIYLNIAYFGYNRVGLNSLPNNEKKNVEQVIARLKYPTKKNQLPDQNIHVNKRTAYITKLTLR